MTLSRPHVGVGGCGCGCLAQLCLTLCNPIDYSPQAPQSKEFFRQEYWSGQPFSFLEHLPHPGIKPESLMSSAFQADSLPSEPPGKPLLRWTFSKEQAEHSCLPGVEVPCLAVPTLQLGHGSRESCPWVTLGSDCRAATQGLEVPMTHPHPSQPQGRLMSH